MSCFLAERGASQNPLNLFVLELQHVLNTNIFRFGERLFIQTQGVAMGARCTPLYANLVLGGWETEIFSSGGLDMYLCQLLCWHGYIDDVLAVWTGIVASLYGFMAHLNQNTWNLKFTYPWDLEKVSFLNIFILKGQEGKISTTLFRKETSENTILWADNAYPQKFIKSSPYGQYLQL